MPCGAAVYLNGMYRDESRAPGLCRRTRECTHCNEGAAIEKCSPFSVSSIGDSEVVLWEENMWPGAVPAIPPCAGCPPPVAKTPDSRLGHCPMLYEHAVRDFIQVDCIQLGHQI